MANVLLVCANSITFKFAEFIKHLHGTERDSGYIVSCGLAAAILGRLWLGRAIDRYGTRAVWLATAGVFIVGNGLFLCILHLGPTLWLARIAYQFGLAGMFSCSMVHIQAQVPASRRTEIIGTLGTSGFVGTIIGTNAGDFLFRHWADDPRRFFAMFGGSALLGLVHLLVVACLTWRDEHVLPRETPHAHRLLRQYWPGSVIPVALVMGSSFAVTTVFLTRFVTSLGLHDLGTFFTGYALTAFCCRWLFRTWSRVAGRHVMVLGGLTSLSCGLFLLMAVRSDWLLLIPAVLCGFGHAQLFPAVVSLGAGRFPPVYRGSGTTLVLGFIEMGTILAAPLLGASIDLSRSYGLSGPHAFWPMFIVAGTLAAGACLFYALTAARQPDVDLGVEPSLATTGLATTELSTLPDLTAPPEKKG